MEIVLVEDVFRITLSDAFCKEHYACFDLIVNNDDSGVTVHLAMLGACPLIDSDMSSARYLVKETSFRADPLTVFSFYLCYHQDTNLSMALLKDTRMTSMFLRQGQAYPNAIYVVFEMGAHYVVPSEHTDSVNIEIRGHPDSRDKDFHRLFHTPSKEGGVLIPDLPRMATFQVRARLTQGKRTLTMTKGTELVSPQGQSHWVTMRTVCDVDFAIQEIGDTFVRVSWHRPGMLKSEEKVESAEVHLWEDPTEYLHTAARRWRARGSLQPREHQRRMHSWSEVQEGRIVNHTFEELYPDRIYFVTFRYQNLKNGKWTERVLWRVRLRPSLKVVRVLRMAHSSIDFEAEQPEPGYLKRYNLMVEYPSCSDLAATPELPYVGPNVKALPDGQVWCNAGVEKYAVALFYETKCTCVHTGRCQLQRHAQLDNIKIAGLVPGELYLCAIRSVTTHGPSAWSPFFVFITPKLFTVHVQSRSVNEISLSYEHQAAPPPVMLSRLPSDTHQANFRYGSDSVFFYCEKHIMMQEKRTEEMSLASEFSDTDVEEVIITKEIDESEFDMRVRENETESQRDARVMKAFLARENSRMGCVRRRPQLITEVPVLRDVSMEDVGEVRFDVFEVSDKIRALLDVEEAMARNEATGGHFVLVKPVFSHRAGNATVGVVKLDSLMPNTSYDIHVAVTNGKTGTTAIVERLSTFTLGDEWEVFEGEKSCDRAGCRAYRSLEVDVRDVCEVYVKIAWTIVNEPSLLARDLFVEASLDEAPNSDQPRRAYQLVIEDKCSGTSRTLYFVTDRNYVSISGLAPNGSFALRLRAVSDSNHWGFWSPTIGLTIPDRFSLEVGCIRLDCVQLLWGRPCSFDEKFISHMVTKYSLRLQNISRPNVDDIIIDVACSDPTGGFGAPETHILHYLQMIPNSLYDVAVAPSYSATVSGEWSNPVRILVLFVPFVVTEYSEDEILVDVTPYHELFLDPACHQSSVRETMLVEIKSDSGRWKRSQEIPSGTLSYVFHDLQPDTVYHFGFTLVQQLPVCDNELYKSNALQILNSLTMQSSTQGKHKTLVRHQPIITVIGEDYIGFDFSFEKGNATDSTVHFQVCVAATNNECDVVEVEHIWPMDVTKPFHCVVEGLQRDTEYTVRCRKSMARGTWGTWSPGTSTRTLPHLKAAVLDVSEFFVKVSWCRAGLCPDIAHSLYEFEVCATDPQGTAHSVCVNDIDKAVVSGLNPHTLYEIRIRQHSVTTWGAWSAPLRVLTQTQLKWKVLTRAETLAEIVWFRDRRIFHCKDAYVNAPREALRRVRIEIINVGTGAKRSLASDNPIGFPTVVSELVEDTTYEIRLFSVYGDSYEFETLLPSVAYYQTLATSFIAVCDVREDSLTVAWRRKDSRPLMVPDSLLSSVETWVSEMFVPTIASWEVRARPGDFVQVIESPICTLDGLDPDTLYSIDVRTTDQNGHIGAWSSLCLASTMPLLSISLSRLADSFVYVSVSRPCYSSYPKGFQGTELGTDTRVNLYIFSHEDPNFHVLVEDASVGAKSQKLAGLQCNHRYGVVARSVNVYPDSKRRSNDWGPWSSQAMFMTLKNPELVVEHIGSDFIILHWNHQLEKIIQEQIAVQRNLIEVGSLLETSLPDTLYGSRTEFSRKRVTPILCSTVTVVEYEVSVTRVGDKGELVTTDAQSVHISVDKKLRTIIKNLQPNANYDVTLRTCYSEQDIGAWLPMTRVAMDDALECVAISIEQTSASFLVQPKSLLMVNDIQPGPVQSPNYGLTKRIREFDVAVNDEPTYQILKIPASAEKLETLKLSSLARDHFHTVTIRELDGRHPCGDWCFLTSFFTQPPPPIPGELTEYLNSIVAFSYGVLHKSNPGIVLFGDDVPAGYVFSVECRGRHGGEWREVAVTKVPHVRFQLEEPIDKVRFRVRLTKHFVNTTGGGVKPVWGEYSEEFYWNDPELPLPPQRLRVSRMNDIDAALEWDPPQNLDMQPGLSYHLYRDTYMSSETEEMLPDGARYAFLGTVTRTKFTVENLTPNTVYRVVIRCESTFGMAARCASLNFCTRIVPNLDHPEKKVSKTASRLSSKISSQLNNKSHPKVRGIPCLKDKAPAPIVEKSFLDNYIKDRSRKKTVINTMVGRYSSRKGTLKGTLSSPSTVPKPLTDQTLLLMATRWRVKAQARQDQGQVESRPKTPVWQSRGSKDEVLPPLEGLSEKNQTLRPQLATGSQASERRNLVNCE